MTDWRRKPPLAKRVTKIIVELAIVGFVVYAWFHWGQNYFSDRELFASDDQVARLVRLIQVADQERGKSLTEEGSRVRDVCAESGVMMGRIVDKVGMESIAIVWTAAVPGFRFQDRPLGYRALEIKPPPNKFAKFRLDEPRNRILGANFSRKGLWYCSFPTFWLEMRENWWGGKTIAELALQTDLARLAGGTGSRIPPQLFDHYRPRWYRTPIEGQLDRKWLKRVWVLERAQTAAGGWTYRVREVGRGK